MKYSGSQDFASEFRLMSCGDAADAGGEHFLLARAAHLETQKRKERPEVPLPFKSISLGNKSVDLEGVTKA